MGLFVLAPSGFAYLTEGGMHSREFYGRCFKITRLNVEWFASVAMLVGEMEGY